ncbi:hypothetical protein [Streptomyces sp. CS147]|uniref:hypothetical protein n=1 Tax=Streptomyces TaxID=1883 RepID=UPI000516E2AB|nr:hypothetical protein [Streptomyces sp. CS147]
MSRARRVLVVGIDGVRLDVLHRVPSPHLDAVADAGGGPIVGLLLGAGRAHGSADRTGPGAARTGGPHGPAAGTGAGGAGMT